MLANLLFWCLKHCRHQRTCHWYCPDTHNTTRETCYCHTRGINSTIYLRCYILIWLCISRCTGNRYRRRGRCRCILSLSKVFASDGDGSRRKVTSHINEQTGTGKDRPTRDGVRLRGEGRR